MIQLKRIYDTIEPSDGFRILVDRLWPRGVSKDEAEIDLWLKDIAPSSELRKWFSHDPEKWSEFQKKYARELEGKSDILGQIRTIEKEKGTVTLLYTAKDSEHNHALVLKKIIG